MARRWRDLAGSTIALLLLEFHHLPQLALSKHPYDMPLSGIVEQCDSGERIRYLYLYLEHAGRIHLLYLFSKGEQANLSPDQSSFLISWLNAPITLTFEP